MVATVLNVLGNSSGGGGGTDNILAIGNNVLNGSSGVNINFSNPSSYDYDVNITITDGLSALNNVGEITVEIIDSENFKVYNGGDSGINFRWSVIING